VWLINAEHLHNVPGRKTDVADSAWIAQMVEHGLVRPSFVPPPPIRQLRDLTRHRRTLVEERTRVVQRLEKVMQDAGIKLTSVASALLTKSGRAMRGPAARRAFPVRVEHLAEERRELVGERQRGLVELGKQDVDVALVDSEVCGQVGGSGGHR